MNSCPCYGLADDCPCVRWPTGPAWTSSDAPLALTYALHRWRGITLWASRGVFSSSCWKHLSPPGVSFLSMGLYDIYKPSITLDRVMVLDFSTLSKVDLLEQPSTSDIFENRV